MRLNKENFFRRRFFSSFFLTSLLFALTVPAAQAREAELPNDPYFDRQKHLQAYGIEPPNIVYYHYGNDWIEAAKFAADHPELFDSTALTLIAVIDTGLDLGSEDIDPNCIESAHNVTTQGGPEDVDDGPNAHGTSVISVICAATNNGIGVAGSFPGIPIKVVAVKGIQHQGYSDALRIPEVKSALQLVIKLVREGSPIKVVNLSLGISPNSNPDYWDEEIKTLIDLGVLVVTSAGNCYSQSACPPSYPANKAPNTEGFLSIGGVDTYFGKETTASLGEIQDVVQKFIIAAGAYGEEYGFRTGTSFGAPSAAQIAAIIYSYKADITPKEVEEIIVQTANQLPNCPSCTGIISYVKAIQETLHRYPQVNPKDYLIHFPFVKKDGRGVGRMSQR